MALLVEHLVKGDCLAAVDLRRDAGRNAFRVQSVAELVAVIALVGNECLGFGSCG